MGAERIKRNMILGVIITTALLSTTRMSVANISEHKMSIETKTGEVNMIRWNYISIMSHKDEVKKEETEMVFLIDENVAFKRKELSELQVGDQVKITYENYTQLDEEGKDVFIKRITKEVHYLRPKSASLSSGVK